MIINLLLLFITTSLLDTISAFYETTVEFICYLLNSLIFAPIFLHLSIIRICRIFSSYTDVLYTKVFK